MNWLLSSLVAMVCWGVWGLFLKLALKYFNWQQTFVVTSILTLTASLLILLWSKPMINVGSTGFVYSLAAGVLGLVALLAFYSAIGSGKAIIVVPLTALYPVVTTILSYLILREEISLIKGLGIVLALVALLLVSIE